MPLKQFSGIDLTHQTREMQGSYRKHYRQESAQDKSGLLDGTLQLGAAHYAQPKSCGLCKVNLRIGETSSTFPTPEFELGIFVESTTG